MNQAPMPIASRAYASHCLSPSLTPLAGREPERGVEHGGNGSQPSQQNCSPLPDPLPALRGEGTRRKSWRWGLSLCLFLLFATLQAHADNTSTINLNLGGAGLTGPVDVDGAIKVVAVMTLLTLAPSIILLMTCFTRIVIVLSFVRSALSLQGAPSNQIIVGLSLFLTFFIMAPTWEKIDQQALQPYRANQITSAEALDRAAGPIRTFMLHQTRPKDVELFADLAKLGPMPADELPLKVVVPGFIISELRTAFQMGFLLFLPFILIDIVVATVLMSMGMMMMPPMSISLPLKILLFVLVDGWHLIVSSIVQSFAT